MSIGTDIFRSRPMPGHLTWLLGAIILLGAGLPISSPVRALDKAKADKKKEPDKEICVTFDELPVALAFQEADRTAVTERLLAALKKHEVKAAGFVVGGNIGDSYD
ncbi:MAG: polysaccharide deacetylase family protein, partial [bacterium]